MLCYCCKKDVKNCECMFCEQGDFINGIFTSCDNPIVGHTLIQDDEEHGIYPSCSHHIGLGKLVGFWPMLFDIAT